MPPTYTDSEWRKRILVSGDHEAEQFEKINPVLRDYHLGVLGGSEGEIEPTTPPFSQTYTAVERIVIDHNRGKEFPDVKTFERAGSGWEECSLPVHIVNSNTVIVGVLGARVIAMLQVVIS